ncbi:MAG: PucR family transcriptional regulator [Dehalococcoidia bacterium]
MVAAGRARGRSGVEAQTVHPSKPASPQESLASPDPAEIERLRPALRALQRENSSQRLLIAIHDRLGALVLQGADVDAITAVLAELVSRPVLLLDPMLKPVALESQELHGTTAETTSGPPLWDPNDAYVSRVLQTIAGERRPLRLPPLPEWGVSRGCVLAPVVIGDTTLGYLAILEPSTPSDEGAVAAEADLLAVQHAASVYALALMRERMAAEVTTQLRDELLEGLLLGHITDEHAIRERAHRLGYDESLIYRTLVFAPDETEEDQQARAGADAAWTGAWRRRLFEGLARLVHDRVPRAIVIIHHEELVVLVPESTDSASTDLGRIATLHAASRYPDRPLTVGIGGPCRTPADIATSYGQARRAVEVARRFGRRGEVVTFEELGLYRLLHQVTDPAELHAFVEQVLGPLLDYDRKHRTDFVHTLATYLTNNGSLQATARALTVHVNTATYRIHRIQAITRLDLTKAEDCLLAQVALMILEGTEHT